jgi:hypothetical protein
MELGSPLSRLPTTEEGEDDLKFRIPACEERQWSSQAWRYKVRLIKNMIATIK